MQLEYRSFIGQVVVLVVLLALQAPCIEAEELTIFWYAEEHDLLTGKLPDVRFDNTDPKRTFYGTEDPPMVNEEEDARKLVDLFRSTIDPAAGNMQRLAYSPGKLIVYEAQRCDSGLHSSTTVFVASNTRISYSAAISMVVQEGKAAMAAGECKNGQWHRQCIFYRNVYIGAAHSFQCGRAHCPKTTAPYRVYCEFLVDHKLVTVPKVYNGMLYEQSTHCQLCPKKKGYCYNNMCVSGDEKKNILAANPSATVTCDAPCMNCGVRKDVGGVCSCHCPTGYDSKVDCSEGTSPLPATCGACQRKGTPCMNGGSDSAGVTEPCKCLCMDGFTGDRCELPISSIGGGVYVPISGKEICTTTGRCTTVPPSPDKIDEITKELKRRTADEINKFCRSSQANYIQCCGSGTLPTTPPFDFIDSSLVHVLKPAKYKNGKLIATLYTSVPGNNGLCRKITSKPVPFVPVPADVLKKVIDDNLGNKKTDCCDATVGKVDGLTKSSFNTLASKKLNCIEIHVK